MLSHIAGRVVADVFCRWDDDVIFKNQARGTDDKRKKEFVNVRLTRILGNLLRRLYTDLRSRIFFDRTSTSDL